MKKLKSERYVWSFSGLECFQNCPRQFYHKYILREKEPQTEAQIYGTNVHTAFEERLRDDKPLPDHLVRLEPVCASIRSRAGDLEIEKGVAVDELLKPTTFFADNVWGRGKVDVFLRRGAGAWIGDWKTGKEREKEAQLRFYATFAFMHHPELQRVVGNYIWVGAGKLGKTYTFTRDKLKDYWLDIIKPLGQIQHADRTENFPPQPSGLCGWCPVKSCNFHKERKP